MMTFPSPSTDRLDFVYGSWITIAARSHRIINLIITSADIHRSTFIPFVVIFGVACFWAITGWVASALHCGVLSTWAQLGCIGRHWTRIRLHLLGDGLHGPVF